MLLEKLAERGERIVLSSPRPPRLAPSIDGAKHVRHDPVTHANSPEPSHDSPTRGAPQRIVVEFYHDDIPPDFARQLSQVDLILWFVEADSEEAATRLARIVLDDYPVVRQRMRVVWLLTGGQRVPPRTGAAREMGIREFKIPMSGGRLGDVRLACHGVNRLVRHVRGLQIGLALAGGGARGMAHLGVLRALDRAGIDFDMMSGTSCGAMAGVVYAAGYDADFCAQSFAHDLTPRGVYRWLPHGKRAFLLLNFRTGGWDPMLRPYLHDWRLEDLPIPFSTIAVDLITCREIVRSTGDAVGAILESINLPVLSTPIFRDGMALVDGGVLNNLPSDVLVRSGADFVVGVDVTRKLRAEFAGRTPTTQGKARHRSTTIETFFRVMETTSRALNDVHVRSADVLIEPDTSQYNFDDFDRACELAEQGEIAAEAMIPRIRESLEALERRLLLEHG
jgi:predicted acylesterase/phospholipase RssA